MINVLTILISIICLYVISAFSGVTMEKLTMYGNSMRLIEVCVMKSLCIFIAYAYIRTIKRQREFVQQELLISGIFLLVFLLSLCFYYPVKTGYVTANLTDSFCSNNAFVSGNHSSCVVALEPLAKSKSRTA